MRSNESPSPSSAPAQAEAATEQLPGSSELLLFGSPRGGKMLFIITLLAIAGIALTSASEYLTHGEVYSPQALSGIVGLCAVLYLLHCGRHAAAIQLFIWTIIITGLLAALYVAGINSPILIVMPLIAMISGLLLGARQTWLIGSTLALAMAAITWLQTQGQLPPPVQRDPLFMCLTLLAICAIGLVQGIFIRADLRDQYSKVLNLSRDLVALNLELEGKVSARTLELSATLEDLKRTQNDLLQSEKLSALGSMVAGISHELNTPIGNTVTLATSLEERATELHQAFEANSLKRSELDNGLLSLKEMAQLLDRSAQRAASLIASFKQVAVDQVSERRRSFDLREMVEENLTTLRPGIKHKPWHIENQIAAGISCDSFPGPLGQVLTNLIQNAILHGFAGKTEGRIEISAKTHDGQLELCVADDGVGMDTATTVRIFEPFFTTKLGHGGSGLGLAISYRIASTILAGEIRAQSSPGTGSQFILTMPLRTPGKL